MNIAINKTSFNGKQEVLYGLQRASESACLIEKARSCSCGPRPTDRTVDIYKHKGELNAYLDMVTSDDSFTKTISEISNSKNHKIYNNLHDKLKPIKIYNTEFSPFTTFKDTFLKICEVKSQLLGKQDKNILSKFFDNISQGLK